MHPAFSVIFFTSASGGGYAMLALLGIVNIATEPSVLGALNPLQALAFFRIDPMLGFLALGGVFLVVTGSEAL